MMEMREVYLRCARNAESFIAKRDAKTGPFAAEIVPGQEPRWHILRTQPARENLAMAHLIGRRFGVYFPTFEKTWKVRGRTHRRHVPLFPGHLFLFVWDVKAHWRRIMACPGVASILVRNEQPIIIEDRDIDRMQAIEFGGVSVPGAKRRKKRRNPGEWMIDNDVVCVSCWSALDGIEHMTDDERVAQLNRALGIAA